MAQKGCMITYSPQNVISVHGNAVAGAKLPYVVERPWHKTQIISPKEETKFMRFINKHLETIFIQTSFLFNDSISYDA